MVPRTFESMGFYAPSMTGQVLTDYQKSKGYEALTSIGAGEGFWVNAEGPFTATVAGGNAVTTAQLAPSLVSGWYLVSIGEEHTTPTLFNAALNADLLSLWAWNAPSAQWYFYAHQLEALGGTALKDYIANKGYLDFTTANKLLDAGTGFWVNMPQSSGIPK